MFNRIEDLPAEVHLFGGREQRRITEQHVQNQSLIGFRRVLGEGAAVAEVHVHVTDLHGGAARHLGSEAHGDALVGLHANHDGVLAEFLRGGRFEWQMWRAFENHCDFRDAFAKTFAGA